MNSCFRVVGSSFSDHPCRVFLEPNHSVAEQPLPASRFNLSGQVKYQKFKMKLHITTLLLSSSLVFGQEEAQTKKIEELDPVLIQSSPLKINLLESTKAWSIISDEKLDRVRGNTIGETLANQPGISQSFFGPSASRPIIRGLDKRRLRMLQNGVDSFGVSSSSEDHAVTIDPFLIDRIEVLRGSSALLYGNSAIGGVVNIFDRSIPSRPYAASDGSLRSSYTSVNDGWNAGAIGFAGSDSFSFQFNGFKKDYGEYDSPIGRIKNSMGESSSIGFGGSHFMENGYAGLSYSKYENTYGIPGEHAENESRIEMESDRFEVRSEIEILDSSWLQSIEFSLGYGDYRHDEIGKHHEEEEDDHEEEEEEHDEEFEIHSTYLREGMETRISFLHEVGSFRGVFGFHGMLNELKIQGEESVFAGASGVNSSISSEDSKKLAFFLTEELDLTENTRINGGVRWENLNRDYIGISGREDSSFSASTGLFHDIDGSWSLGGNLNVTERTPDTFELYSDGPHHATEAFEIGDPSLDNETAVGVEVILRRTLGKVTGQFTAYQTQFDDYIFLEDTGNEQLVEGEHLPERKYEAAKAEFRGLEAELDWLAMENSGWSLMLSAYGDVVRAMNETGGTNLPRISPARLGVGFHIQQEKLSFGMNLNRVFKQNRISEHEEEEGGDDDHEHGETATAAYSLLNAYASYGINIGGSQGEIFIRGRNLTDELARVHTSFLKESAPLPGRSFEIGLNMKF